MAVSRLLFFANLLMVIIPASLWFAFVGPNFLDLFGNEYWWVLLIGALMETHSVINSCICCFKDPGKLPKGLIDYKLREFYENQYYEEQEKQLVKVSVSNPSPSPKKGLDPLPKPKFDDLYPLDGDGPKKKVVVNGIEISIKYCKTCNIWKPPRASHCRVCNSCIEEFDHHCPWVGNCVGKRTYPFFAMFLHSTVGLLVVVFVVSIAVIAKKFSNNDGDDLGSVLKDEIMACLMVAYTGIIILSVGGLWVYHLYLQIKGLTTNEQITFKYGGQKPFDQGPLKNFFGMQCFFNRPRWGERSNQRWALSAFCDHDYIIEDDTEELASLTANVDP